MFVIDGDVIRLHGRIGKFHETRCQCLGINARQRVAPGIAHPQHIGVLVGAHAARALRPRQRDAEIRAGEIFEERAVIRIQAVEFRLQRRQFHRNGFATGDIAFADGVHRHLRPPAVAVAVARCAVSCTRAFVGSRRGFEFAEAFGFRIKAHGAVGCGGPDFALAVDIHGDRAPERRHIWRCLIDSDFFSGHFELAQAATAGVDVEPEVAVFVAHQTMRSGGVARGIRGFDVFHFAGFGVHLADGHVFVRIVGGEINIAVESQAAIVRHLADFGGGAERPVGAVVRIHFGADAGDRAQRQVIKRPHHARRFSGGARTGGHFHRRFTRPARTCEIRRQRFLYAIQQWAGLGGGAGMHAVVGHHFHQVDDLVPARLIKAELQHIARRVARGAIVGEDFFHERIFRRGFGQRCHHQFAGQLAIALLGIRHRRQSEIVAAFGIERD